MMLSTKGRYAVMAMVDLATQAPDKPVTLAAIAQRQEIPLAYLEQIFAKLKRRNIVQSVRGPGGGYKLFKAADQTCISSIVIAAEEDMTMTRCGGSEKPGCMASNKARCLTHDLWEGLQNQIEHYLQSLTLADVCGRKVKDKFPREGTMFAELLMKDGARA